MTDDQLLVAFESLALPFSQWTHRAHVRVAFCYLRRHPFDEALARMRAGIRAYNAHHAVPDGPTSGDLAPLPLSLPAQDRTGRAPL